MADQEKIDALLELERRGKLPSDRLEAISELRRRGKFPDAMEKPDTTANSASRGALGGGLEATGMVGGAILGSPGGPAGMVAGGVLGLLFGNQLRDLLSNVRGPISGRPLTFSNLSEIPEDERPAAVAGESIAAAVPFGGVPFLPAMKSAASPVLRSIANTATNFPKTFIASESAAAAGSGAGAALAEKTAPGDATARLAGEAVGGVLASGQLLTAAGRAGIGGFKQARATLTRSGREDAAAKIVQDIVALTDDPKEIVARLREADLPKVRLTSGQKSQNRGLILLEKSLESDSASFSADARKVTDEALEVLKQNIDDLSRSGDPSALKAASEVRQRYFTGLLQKRMDAATREATEAAAEINPGSSRVEGSVNLRNIRDASLSSARSQERTLWSPVRGDFEADIGAILTTRDSFTGGPRPLLLPNEKLPKQIRGFVEKFEPREVTDADGNVTIETPDPPTADQLMTFRSRMLELMRAAKGSTDESARRNMRIYGQFAEAALDDLDVAFQGADAAVRQTYDTARDFTKSLNDVFTRTFAGQVGDTGAKGRARVPPELLGQEAGREVELFVNFRDLRNAAEFADPQFGQAMFEAQEDFLRTMAQQTVDPLTGVVDPNRLAIFRRQNAEHVLEFPSLAKVLDNAEEAQKALQRVETGVTKAEQAIAQGSAFGRLLNGRDVPSTVDAAITSPRNPTREYSQLGRLARRGGAEALEGLRAATMDFVVRKSRNAAGGVSFTKADELLFRRTAKGRPPLFSLMVKEGVMSGKDVKLLRRFIKEGMKVEQAARTTGTLGDIGFRADAFTNLAARIAGANIGGASVVGQASGASLVTAGATSRLFQNLLDKIPGEKVQTVLTEAALNPEFMSKLLERPVTPRQALLIATQMNGYLWQAGLLAPTRGEDEIPPSNQPR